MNPIKIVTLDNLEKYTEIVENKLEERVSEPSENGTSGDILATDGSGTRYWKKVNTAEECTDEEILQIFAEDSGKSSQ